jgi:hypothetical protein
MKIAKHVTTRVVASGVVSAVALSLAAAGAGSTRRQTGNHTDTRAALSAMGMAAMLRASTLAHVDPDLASVIAHMASGSRGDASLALRTLRLLRARLGATTSDLYAYTIRDGVVCVQLWRRQGVCATHPTSAATPNGLVWLFSPGGPGYLGQAPDVPAAVAGTVANDIQSVTVSSDGRTFSPQIINNAFFAEIAPRGVEPTSLQLVVRYANGAVKSTARYKLMTSAEASARAAQVK